MFYYANKWVDYAKTLTNATTNWDNATKNSKSLTDMTNEKLFWLWCNITTIFM